MMLQKTAKTCCRWLGAFAILFAANLAIENNAKAQNNPGIFHSTFLLVFNNVCSGELIDFDLELKLITQIFNTPNSNRFHVIINLTLIGSGIGQITGDAYRMSRPLAVTFQAESDSADAVPLAFSAVENTIITGGGTVFQGKVITHLIVDATGAEIVDIISSDETCING